MRQVTSVALLTISLFISLQIQTIPVQYATSIECKRVTFNLILKESKIENQFVLTQSSSMIWNLTCGGNDWDVLYTITECSSGGYLAAGYTYSFGAGGSDIWAIRLDENGSMMWNRTYGGIHDEKAYSVIECNEGGFALAGLTTSFGAGGSDAWLLRINDSGTLLWNNTFGGPNYDEAWSLLQRDDGSFALGGTFSHETEGWDMWLILADENGEHDADYRFGGPLDDVCYSMIECSDGGFALAGYTNSFGSGQYDYYLVRAGEDGAFNWNRTYGGSWFDELGAIVECSSGGFALIGESTSSPGECSNAWLVRTDDQGNQLWNRTYAYGTEDNRCYTIIESNDDDLVFTSCHGDVHVVRVDHDGTMLWSSAYHIDLFDIAWSLIESSNHGFIVAGYAAHLYGGPKAHIYDALVMHVADFPRWSIIPPNLTSEFTHSFSHQLMAEVPHGVDQWWLEHLGSFSINENGLVYNSTLIMVGEHTISVRVNDTLGNELAATFGINVEDTQPPTWIQEPEDQTLNAVDTFRYDLNATDPSGIVQWIIDDSANFAIDDDGVITNLNSLIAGVYDLEVEVEDPYGNILSASFTITVIADDTGSLVIVAVVVISVIVLVITVIYVRRRRVGT